VAFSQIPTTGDQVAGNLEINTETHPGALSISDNVPVVDAEPIPDATELRQRLQEYYSRGCSQEGGNEPGTDEITVCDDQNAPDSPTARVALAAGSHAGQWEDAVRSIGSTYNWEVLTVIKSGCVLLDDNDPERRMCQSWNDNFIEWVGENDIDLVITPGTRVFGSGESVRDGAPKRWEEITDQGADLLLVRGTPRPRDGGAECVEQEQSLDECGVTAGDVALPNPLLAMDLPDGTETIDLNQFICPSLDEGEESWCPALVGNVFVWRDGSHLSREYVTTLAPSFEREMHEVFPEYFE
jgi:hypothetical protein